MIKDHAAYCATAGRRAGEAASGSLRTAVARHSGRGEQTREILLAAAVQVFGRDGFHAASTRAIAAEAGANQALIGYHFGGKQGLYEAAVDFIKRQIASRIEPQLTDLVSPLEALPAGTAERGLAAARALSELSCILLDSLAEASRRGWVRLILREQQDPGPVMEQFFEAGIGRVLALATRLTAEASGLDEASQACRVSSMMLMGQVLVFVTARGTVHHLLGWSELDSKQLDLIKAQLRAGVAAHFQHGD